MEQGNCAPATYRHGRGVRLHPAASTHPSAANARMPQSTAVARGSTRTPAYTSQSVLRWSAHAEGTTPRSTSKPMKSFPAPKVEYEEPIRKTLVGPKRGSIDRKSTRLNSSHANISYAVFCLKKKKKKKQKTSNKMK